MSTIKGQEYDIELGRWYFGMGGDEYPYVIRADSLTTYDLGSGETVVGIVGPITMMYGGYGGTPWRFDDSEHDEAFAPTDEEVMLYRSWATKEEALRASVYFVKGYMLLTIENYYYNYLARAGFFGPDAREAVEK